MRTDLLTLVIKVKLFYSHFIANLVNPSLIRTFEQRKHTSL